MSVEIKVPNLGESVSEAVIARWVVADGQQCNIDDVVVELESDKSMMEILAEKGGKVSVSVEEGTTVEVGQVIGSIDPDAKADAPKAESKAQPKAEEPAPTPAHEAPAAKQQGKDRTSTPEGAASPAASKIAKERGIEVTDIDGTGPGGRVLKSDAQKAQASSKPAESSPASASPAPVERPTEGGQRREKMSLIRRKIAQRLLASQHGTASLTTFNEIDMSAVMQTRSTYKDAFEKKHGVRLGFMSFFARASVLALQEFEDVNAFIDGEEIVYNNDVNIAIAVGTPRGLVVPVIRAAQHLSMDQLEGEIARLGQKGKEGKITPDEMMGGTFTLSNGGVYGSLLSTPILNPPQSGILGMHKIEQRPVAIDGEVVIRPMMYLALTYDHRIIDGEQAVKFLVRIKERMEDPVRMLLEV